MKTEIISLLRQRGTYVSGQELCERFGVSRTAVWKAVEQLKKDGYKIEAVKNRGYLLTEESGQVFGRTEIESRLKTNWIGQSLYYYDSIDSTNVQAKRLAEEGAPDGSLVVADQQTAGRGRRGRGWISPAGANLYFTLLLRPRIAPDKASMLTLVMAMAVARGIQSRMGDGRSPGGQNASVGIKWPNDIVIMGRKACGILTELSLSVEQGTIDYLVIGVGINVKRQTFSEELQGHAIALEEVLDEVSRSELLNAVLTAFEGYYEEFLATGDLTRLQKDYNELMVNLDQQVRVLDPKAEYEGIARGIRNTGELLVEIQGGETRAVYAGEVSVRGIYGYV